MKTSFTKISSNENSCSMVNGLKKSVLIFSAAFALLFANKSAAQDCTVNAGLPQTICPHGPFTLTGVVTGNLAAVPNPLWTIVSGPGGTIADPSSPITTVDGYLADATQNTTLVYRLSATCLDNVRTHQDVVVTLKRKPTHSSVGPNLSYCTTGTYGPLAGSTPGANETGLWTSFPASGVTFADPTSPTTNFTLSQPGTYTFTWTITTSGPGQLCNEAAQMTVVESGPATISAGSDQTVSCSGNSITLSGSNPGLSPQVGVWTLVSGPNTPTFSNVNSASSSMSNLIPGTYVVKWSVSGPCASGSATKTITVLNTYTTQGAGSLPTLTYCIGSGVTDAVLVGTTPNPGATVAWSASGSPATSTTIDSPNSAITVVTGLDGSSAAVYNYHYTITSLGGCSSTGTAKIEFVDGVSLVAPANVNIVLPCGSTGTTFTITRSAPASLTGSNITATSTGLIGDGTASLTSSSGFVDTWTISTCTPDTVNRIRFTYSTPCSSAFIDVTFVTSSSASGTNAGTDQILPCSLLHTDLAGNQVTAPNYGSWYEVTGPNAVTIADLHQYDTYVSGFTYGDYTFRWEITNGLTCLGNDDSVNIAVPPPIGTNNAGSDATICYGTPYKMVSTGCQPGQSVRWDVSPSAGVTFTPNNTVENPTVDGMSASTAYTFTKTIYIPCDSLKSSVVITTTATQGAAQANAGADQCLAASTTTISLTGNNPSPNTGTWSAVGTMGGTITSPNSASTTVTGMTPGTYTFVWTIDAGGCGATTDTVIVTISNAATTANAGSNQTLCNVTSTNLSANVASVGTGVWSQIGGASGATITSPNSNTTSVTGLTTGSYFFNWTISNGACASNSSMVAITISAPVATTSTAGSDQTICASSATLAGNSTGAGETGMWDVISIPAGAPVPSFSDVMSPTSTVSNMVTGDYVLQWTISTVGSCTSSMSQTTLHVGAPASINMATNYCGITSISLMGTIGTNGTWSVTSQPASSPTVGFLTVIPGYSYSSEATPVVTGSYTFRYDVPSTGSCGATFATKTVNIYQPVLPTDAGSDINICLGTTSTTLGATAPSIGSGVWSKVSGPNSPTFGSTSSATSSLSNLVPGIYDLKWTVTNGTCPSASDIVQINVERAASAGSSQALCAANTTILTGNAPVLGSGTWSYVSGPSGSTIASPNSPITDVNGLVPGSYVFEWSTPLAGCAANVSDVSIVISAQPTTANAGPDQSSVGWSTVMAANTPSIGTGSWSVLAGAAVPTFSSLSSPTSGVSGLVFGNYILQWTITNGSCSSSSTMTINNNLPLVADITSTNVCNPTGTGSPASITSLSAIDSNTGASISNYTIVTLPTLGTGTLYYNNGSADVPATIGQSLSPTEATTLTFVPFSGFTGNTTFTYSATDNFGYTSKTATYTIPVLPGAVAGFTIPQATTQDLLGNSFTVQNSAFNVHYNYVYDFDNGLVVHTPSATMSYTAAGVYTVTQTVTYQPGGCTASYATTVAVLSGGIPGGGSGGSGLESESLGGLVAQRDFNYIRNSVNTQINYATLPVFLRPMNNVAAKTSASSSVSILQRMVPATLNSATTPYVTTPTDLTSLTTAKDVFALDYVEHTDAKAAVLALTTLKKAYNHTKSICDRFRGATLTGTQVVTIQGYKFIQYTLRQNGIVEYCIAFDAGKSAGRNSFDLQSNWLINQYAGDDSVFNFQAWAADPANTQVLVDKMLTNLAAIMPVNQIDTNFKVPPAYIASGVRNKASLDITITNNTPITSALLHFDERVNEDANVDNLDIPLTLTTGTDNKISIPIKDGYEYPGNLYLNGELVDVVYMADGNWSVDYDHATTKVATNVPGNEPTRVYVDGEYNVYRSLTLDLTTPEYVSAYKFISSGDDATDLSAYHTLKFTAQSQGMSAVTIRLIKSSITNWDDQYQTTVKLDAGVKSYALSFDDFVSPMSKLSFDPKDVTAVVYTFNMGGANTNLHFYTGSISFSPEAVLSNRLLESKTLSIVPNPNEGSFSCKFESDVDREIELIISDVTGRIVYRQNVQASVGANTVQVAIPSNVAGAANYIISLGDDKVKYAPIKMTITQ